MYVRESYFHLDKTVKSLLNHDHFAIDDIQALGGLVHAAALQVVVLVSGEW